MLNPISISSLALVLGGCATETATPEAAPAKTEAPVAAPEAAPAAAVVPAFADGAVAPADIPWMAVFPDQPDGPKMSLLSGNPKEGAFTALVMLPAGHASGLRYHPATVHGMMISGTLTNGRSAEDVVKINPGDMWMQPGGEAHFTGCTEAADCIFVGRMEGAMGPVPAETPVEVSTQKVVAAADLDLQPLNPEQPNGPRLKVLTGDMKAGPWSGIALIPAGVTTPKRKHGSSFATAVVSGTGAGDDISLAEGSIWRETAGTVHTTGCVSESDCIFFISMDGPLDITPVE